MITESRELCTASKCRQNKASGTSANRCGPLASSGGPGGTGKDKGPAPLLLATPISVSSKVAKRIHVPTLRSPYQPSINFTLLSRSNSPSRHSSYHSSVAIQRLRPSATDSIATKKKTVHDLVPPNPPWSFGSCRHRHPIAVAGA